MTTIAFIAFLFQYSWGQSAFLIMHVAAKESEATARSTWSTAFAFFLAHRLEDSLGLRLE
jgi:hypothetical protein